MKSISPTLQQGISKGTIATCVKITDKNNIVYGFTDHDVPLVVDSVTYKPAPGLQRIVMNLRNNAEVSNQEFTAAWVVDLSEDDLTKGLFDDAPISVFRVDWSNLAAGKVSVFEGNLGLVQWTADGFRADVHSLMKALARIIGVEVTAKCRHKLFSVAGTTGVGYCGVSSASFTYTGSVSASPAPNNKVFYTTMGTGSGQVSTWFANGILTFTSGLNSGASFEIKSHDPVTYKTELFLPTPYAVQAGDTFTVHAGCDKTTTTCKNKFNNIVRFGGFPHIKAEVNFK